MSNWDKMDKQVWEQSEVFQEYEKHLIKAALQIQHKIEAQQQTQEISRKLDTINKGVESTSKNLNSFLETAKNLAQDNPEEITDESEEVVLEPTPEEQAQAKAALLEELNELAAQACRKGNYKLAYKIERSIDQIMIEG